MAVEITGVPGAPLTNKQTDTTKTGTVSSNVNSSSPNINAGSSPTADSFTVSQQAERLRVIESTVNAQPDVDDSRVESLKAAIDTGRYDIDPVRVAEKLIELETQFVA